MQKPDTLNLVYYSPTGTTKKIIKEIANGLKIPRIQEYNLTTQLPDRDSAFSSDSLTIIGLPTYSGRLPANAVEKLQILQSKQTPVVLVVVYGNRDFDDALLELKNLVVGCGFTVIAAAVFIGEHSFSTDEKPIALGRPDELDIIKCHEFSQKIAAKVAGFNNSPEPLSIPIPGNVPYKALKKLPPLSPETNMDLCDMCGICAEVCPTQAISMKDEPITNKDLCTWCCACVKSCPTGARIFDNPAIQGVQDRLFANCSERKEPEFFV